MTKVTLQGPKRSLPPRLLGTLRSYNGDVHGNVAEQETSHPFKLFRDYPNSPCYLKDGNFGWS